MLALKDFSHIIERIRQKDEELLLIDDDDRNTINSQTTHVLKVTYLMSLNQGHWHMQLDFFARILDVL